jgi:hypothetical protein
MKRYYWRVLRHFCSVCSSRDKANRRSRWALICKFGPLIVAVDMLPTVLTAVYTGSEALAGFQSLEDHRDRRSRGLVGKCVVSELYCFR